MLKFFLIIKVIIVLTLSSGLVHFELLVLPLGSHYSTLCEVRKDVRALAGIFNDKMKVLELYFASKKGSQQWHFLSHWQADTSLASLTYKNRKPEGLNFASLQFKDEALRLCLWPTAVFNIRGRISSRCISTFHLGALCVILFPSYFSLDSNPK